MLDIFLTTFITAGMLFVVLDRERMDAVDTVGRWPRIDSMFGSPYRLWAGVAFGAAVATKWSGAFALLVRGRSLLGLGVHRRSASAIEPSCAPSATLVASFVVVPLGVYLLSYGAFFFQHGPRDPRLHHAAGARCSATSNTTSASSRRTRGPGRGRCSCDPIRYFRAARGERGHHDRRARATPRSGGGSSSCCRSGSSPSRRRPTWRDAVIFGGYLAMYPPVVRGAAEPVPLLHASGCPVHVSRRRRDPACGFPVERRRQPRSCSSRSRRSSRCCSCPRGRAGRRPRAGSAACGSLPHWPLYGRTKGRPEGRPFCSPRRVVLREAAKPPCVRAGSVARARSQRR